MTKRYNKKAQDWVDGGLREFDNLSFTVTTSGSDRPFEKHNTASGVFYPCRDSCKLKGDPSEGCIYTGDLHYAYYLIMLEHDNHFIVKDDRGNVIVETRMDSNATITRTAKEISCSLQPSVWEFPLMYSDRCQNICDDMGGVWDHRTERCEMTVYADLICYRLVQKDGRWMLDSDKSSFLPRDM